MAQPQTPRDLVEAIIEGLRLQISCCHSAVFELERKYASAEAGLVHSVAMRLADILEVCERENAKR